MIDHEFFNGNSTHVSNQAPHRVFAIVSGEKKLDEKLNELNDRIQDYLEKSIQEDGELYFKDFIPNHEDYGIFKKRYENCLTDVQLLQHLKEPVCSTLNYDYLLVSYDESSGYEPLLVLDSQNKYISLKFDLDRLEPISETNPIKSISIVYQSVTGLIELYKFDQDKTSAVQQLAEKCATAKNNLTILSLA